VPSPAAGMMALRIFMECSFLVYEWGFLFHF